MKIMGIDQSLTSTGITTFSLDSDLNLQYVYFTFTTKVKKYKKKGDITPLYIGKHTGTEAAIATVNSIVTFRDPSVLWEKTVDDIDYFAMEGYSFGSQGRSTFTLGELGGMLKWNLSQYGNGVRVYEPTIIKKYATLKGNAGKLEMYQAFKNEGYEEVLKYFGNEVKSPLVDIIDSYFIAKLLLLELQLRYGIKQLKDQKLHEIEIFNQVSKHNKVNILARPFLKASEI